MKVDPLASLQCWEIDFTAGGQTYTIPALPASEWWPVLSSGDPLEVLSLLPGNEGQGMEDLLLAGKLGGEQLSEALQQAVEEAAGRSMHAAYVLAYVAGMHWPVINGQLMRSGLRWDVMPLGAMLDAVHSLLVESLPEEGRGTFLAELEKGEPAEDREIVKAAKAAFEDIAGPKPTTGVRRPVQSTGEQSAGTPSRTPRRSRSLRRPGPSGGPTETLP